MNSPLSTPPLWLFYLQESLIVALMVLNLVIYEILAPARSKCAVRLFLCLAVKSIVVMASVCYVDPRHGHL